MVTGDRMGRVFVVQIRNAMPWGPPLIFDSQGSYRGTLGGFGRGPGESEHPDWVVAGEGDTLFIFEGTRLVTFDSRIRHVATRSMGRWISRPIHVTSLGNGQFAAIGTGPIEMQPRPIELLSIQSQNAAPNLNPAVDKDAGPLRVLAPVPGARAEVWVAQWGLTGYQGYDLYRVGSGARMITGVRRRPDWWIVVSPQQAAATPGPPTSTRVVDIREVQKGVVAVLLAHPAPGASARRIHPKTFAGWWNRYETILELIDIEGRRKLAEVRAPGYPRGFSGAETFVTYRESDDEPELVLTAFSVPRAAR